MIKRGQRFTLADWRAWPDTERWELIRGEAYDMSPAPRMKHQKVALHLAGRLERLLEGKPCQAFIAPFDVFLPAANEEDTVVEPDVLVVCDPAKVQDDGVHGAPDFIAEVLSDGTAYKDLGIKKQLYESAGVREYWVIHPHTRAVSVYLLENGRFAPAKEYPAGQDVPAAVLPGFTWCCPG